MPGLQEAEARSFGLSLTDAAHHVFMRWHHQSHNKDRKRRQGHSLEIRG
jgi:hypothetical protein